MTSHHLGDSYWTSIGWCFMEHLEYLILIFSGPISRSCCGALSCASSASSCIFCSYCCYLCFLFFFKTFSLPCVYKLIISWKIGKLKIIGIRASWLSWTIVLWTRCWYQYIFRGGTLNTEMMLFRITNLTFFIAL